MILVRTKTNGCNKCAYYNKRKCLHPDRDSIFRMKCLNLSWPFKRSGNYIYVDHLSLNTNTKVL